MRRYNFPDNKDFAFTIFDDTDNATIGKIKPVYDLLYNLGMKTTKSVWPLRLKKHNRFSGQTLQDDDYLNFILDLKQKGFEIALHSVGSGFFTREEIIEGIEEFKNKLGEYPRIHANHARNSDNIYSGYKKFSFPFNYFYRLYNNKESQGDVEDSPCFWGDIHKKYIKYTRSHHFKEINTLKSDPYMPYIEKRKLKYSNFCFSSTYTPEVTSFNKIIKKTTIDRLAQENGICIVYTHFSGGFVSDNGDIDKTFKENMEYLSNKNGFFVPVSELLDFMLEQRYTENYEITYLQKVILDFKFFLSNFIY